MTVMPAQHEAELIVRGRDTVDDRQLQLIERAKSTLPKVWVTVELEDEVDWITFEPIKAIEIADRVIAAGRVVKDRHGRRDEP